MQVDIALHPTDEGGGGDEWLDWCCLEPSYGSMAKPLPSDDWFLDQLWGGGKEQPGKPILLQEEIVGTCGLSTEVDAEESLPPWWEGLSKGLSKSIEMFSISQWTCCCYGKSKGQCCRTEIGKTIR